MTTMPPPSSVTTWTEPEVDIVLSTPFTVTFAGVHVRMTRSTSFGEILRPGSFLFVVPGWQQMSVNDVGQAVENPPCRPPMPSDEHSAARQLIAAVGSRTLLSNSRRSSAIRDRLDRTYSNILANMGNCV